MYCTSCGIELPDSHRYCNQCGTPTGGAASTSLTRQATRILSRPREGRKIAGVCAGLARYLGIDVTLVRILVVVLTLCPPSGGIIFYLICWIVMPKDVLLLPPPIATSSDSQGIPVAT